MSFGPCICVRYTDTAVNLVNISYFSKCNLDTPVVFSFFFVLFTLSNPMRYDVESLV